MNQKQINENIETAKRIAREDFEKSGVVNSDNLLMLEKFGEKREVGDLFANVYFDEVKRLQG